MRVIVDVRPVALDDRARALLAANHLPTDDLDALDAPAIALFGAVDGAALAGVVGLQVVGDVGLLRSLAVAPAARGSGLGAGLCDRVTHEAHARGLAALWLLTTTARGYFERRGFTAVPRAEVAPAIQATAQYSSLCPASAIVMRRDLAPLGLTRARAPRSG